MNKLHILNGDSALTPFLKSGIAGKTVVWRDMLCEGPCTFQLDPNHWEIRTQYFKDYYQVDPSEFKRKTIDEWEKINSTAWEEITLWFEYDLFCQINMIALISHISQNFNTIISLVCVGELDGYDHLVGLGELDYSMYPDLYENKTVLSQNDIEYAAQTWKAYCDGDYTLLEGLRNDSHNTFSYLPQAIDAHFRRFPTKDVGFTEIESEILSMIRQKPMTKNQIIGHLLKQNWVYGFGDLQYKSIFDSLRPILIERAGLYFLGEESKNQLTHGNTTFKRNEKDMFGAIKVVAFEYDPITKSAIPIQSV